jgi:hypothetical protein
MIMGDYLSLVRNYLRGEEMDDVYLPEQVGDADEYTDNNWSW